MPGLRAFLRFVVIGGLALRAAGCAPLVQETRVESRFRSDYQCSSAFTRAEPGGYSVSGCGVVAHYRCLSGRHYNLFDTDPSECFLADIDELRARPLSPVERVTTHEDARLGVVVHGEAEVSPGGRVTLVGAPLKEPHRVVMELHLRDRVASGECSAKLYRDGIAVSVLHADSIGNYDLRWIVDVSGLAEAQGAARIAGEGCGVSFELDDAGRHMLGVFAARFQEELVKATPEG